MHIVGPAIRAIGFVTPSELHLYLILQKIRKKQKKLFDHSMGIERAYTHTHIIFISRSSRRLLKKTRGKRKEEKHLVTIC